MKYRSNYVWVNGLRTHYLEAGEGQDVVIMIHSGEFSASAEFSWGDNIESLSSRFHVYCPDLMGFGGSEKIYNFENPNNFRLRQLQGWIDTLGIRKAHFVGNSFSANFLLTLAADQSPQANALPIDKIVAVSAGYGTNQEVRKALSAYVPDKESMRSLLKILFYNEKWWTDPYLEQRYRSTLELGAWEAVAASRFAPPGKDKPWKGVGAATDYTKITNKVLLVNGEHDDLAPPEAAKEVHSKIGNSALTILPDSKHCPHIEQSESFNKIVLEFLSASS